MTLFVLLLVLLGCRQECPAPGDRFDPTAWGYEPTPGRSRDTADPHYDEYFCVDGTYNVDGQQNGYVVLACNLDWCTQAGNFCVDYDMWRSWYMSTGMHPAPDRHGGAVGIYCTPREEE